MAVKPKFNPRKMMEKAIEVMEQSVAEVRYDGKKSPLVGAVLVMPDGKVETAARGELRDGDHAEFTLLERKNRSSKLDGGILFATLEPCAPGARKHPKLGCAERIVNARIKAVWVGIEDPDPAVDRKGISYLQKHGVTVHMFDHDLQERIQQANKEFFEQAEERKAAAGVEEEKDIVLSNLENPVAAVNFSDLSLDALNEYRSFAKISDGVETDAFQRRLLLQGLLRKEGAAIVPSGFGLLLFGKSPRDAIQQTGLLGTIHYPDGTEEFRDFEGPAVLIPQQVMQWLRDKLPNPVSRSGAQREEASKGFYELVREGVVNALVHRDYDIRGAKCQLAVTPDTIVIKSPGEPVEPITLKQLQSFDAPMLSRNPVLHYVFAKMGLAEERGLGLKSMRTRATEIGLPQPKYEWDNPYLILSFFRSSAGVVNRLRPSVRKSLKDDAQASWMFIASQPSASTPELMAKMGFDERKAQRILRRLKDAGLLERVGRGPATRYKAAL